MYQRTIETLVKNDLFKGKIIIIFGPRQVGKTTLSKKILQENGGSSAHYFDCEVQAVHDFLVPNPRIMKDRFGDARLVVLDEAQYVPDIGRVLKVFHDAYPDTQLLVTGSSAFDLANKMSESLAGRAREYHLFPLSVEEIVAADGRVAFDTREETFFRFGMYPGIIQLDHENMRRDLEALQSAVLYKDMLALDGVKKPRLLMNLLSALALQVGAEVSNSSLANLLDTSVQTVNRYVDILEKMFIIKRLYSLSRNPRVEIRKGYKVYFIDLGIRNSIIQNHNPLAIRNDAGALFENFFIVERLKHLTNHRKGASMYFWRTQDGKEIDYVEEYEGVLTTYECALAGKSVAGASKRFRELYPEAPATELVTRKNVVSMVVS